MTRVVALVTVSLALLMGCAGLPGSEDAMKEQVEIRMLTLIELNNYDPGTPGGRTAGPAEREVFSKRFAQLQETEAWQRYGFGSDPDSARIAPVALAAAAVPVLAGFAVDLIQSRLDAEALKYEAQYGSSVVQSGYWEKVERRTEGGLKGAPKYVGFEILRKTEPNADYDGIAARFVYLFIPADDTRLFLIHPFYSRVEHTKAKLSRGGGSATVVSDIAISSVWIDSTGRTVTDTVAVAKFERGGVVPHEPGQFKLDPETQSAGWFAGVPVSRRKNDQGNEEAVGTGVFRLTVSVTERDETKVRANIERISRFVGNNKERVVEYVSEQTP